MNYEACRFAFDCLNTSGWMAPLWTLIGVAFGGIVIWILGRFK